MWVIFTLLGAAGQVARNSLQRHLTPQLGALGATLVRFLFGFPFALLFLGLAWLATGAPLPAVTPAFALWIVLGALTQIAATALMLKTMERRSFIVTTAYLKSEPVLVALMGVTLLGDHLTPLMTAAILLATLGVVLISVKPKTLETSNWASVWLGLTSAGLFAASAIGYRGAILALDRTDYIMPASFALAVGLALQTALLLAWFGVARRGVLRAVLVHWRPSLAAGFTGAAASQMWFLAFALATAASVRTLALVEVLFAQIVAKFIFRQGATAREAAGIALLVAGAILIVWAEP
jgi:drug/metabolite transporter (DMT)-like permease